MLYVRVQHPIGVFHVKQPKQLKHARQGTHLAEMFMLTDAQLATLTSPLVRDELALSLFEHYIKLHRDRPRDTCSLRRSI